MARIQGRKTLMRKRPAVLIALAVAGVLGLASSAGAGTIKVTNTNDSGPGSLRTAIHRANQIHGFDRIVVDATGTIELRSGLPHMRSKIAIRGRSSKK